MVSARFVIELLFATGAFATAALHAQEAAPVSRESQTCVDCHQTVNPGVVEDCRLSRHARATPEQGLQKKTLERRISAASVPQAMEKVAVSCFECHGQNPDKHKDTFEHFGSRIHTVVTPEDCRTCHPTEVKEYEASKKAHALDILRDNALFDRLVHHVTGVKKVSHGGVVALKASEMTRLETCYGCHGAQVRVKGMRKVETDLGEIEVPDLENWPNQGVGRINPDGSKGSCSACHTRHRFSIEMARKPYTCSQCHLDPDVPAYNVYMESKHGNLFAAHHEGWQWEEVPWKAGKDFQAPTCATCHNSLITTPDGDVLAERTHDFGARLWVRLFGLIYSHPQPKDGNTSIIRNSQGQPLPTTFSGELAGKYLISPEEQARRQAGMEKLCQGCHSGSWVKGHFTHMDNTLRETDQMVKAATDLLQQAWKEGIADPKNPFDESLEHRWIGQWLFYANSVRYAAAMSGPDYATFKNGWWDLTRNLQAMHETILSGRRQKKATPPRKAKPPAAGRKKG